MLTYTNDGLTFDYLDEGEGDPVVLLHGFPEDSSCWAAVSSRLHAAGLRTLAPDQRGYSPGARPRDRGEYRMRHLSADVVALLDAVGLERAHVVGHDWGGGVAWDLAARYPRRVAGIVVLATPHPLAMQWAFRHSDQLRRSWYMVGLQLPWLPERLIEAMLPRQLSRSGLEPSAVQRYAARFRDPRARTGPINWYRAIPYSARRCEGPVDPVVRVPTTYLWGRRDEFLGEAAARRTEDYVCADYREIALDASHWLPELEPDAVAKAVIDRVRSAAG